MQRVQGVTLLFAAVFARYEEIVALEGGYGLRYPAEGPWEAILADFATHAAHCLPTLSVRSSTDANGRHRWLHITGPDGTREFIEDWIRPELRAPSAFRTAASKVSRYLTSGVRRPPDFLIIGAARCGTTSFHASLNEHPCVEPTWRKEIYFFDRHWAKGLSWYRAHFPIRHARTLAGEATPCYLIHPHVPRRVLDTVPKVRLIALLRDPVDRAYSFYQMKLRYGFETLPFEEAVEREADRLAGEMERMLEDESYYAFAFQHYSYLHRGIYAEQLSHWLKHFSRDQLLILDSHSFDSDPSGTMRHVSAFLDLPEPPDAKSGARGKKLNFAPYPAMKASTRRELTDYFRPHNQRLYHLLGRDFGWKERSGTGNRRVREERG
jgi:hypothetical protein